MTQLGFRYVVAKPGFEVESRDCMNDQLTIFRHGLIVHIVRTLKWVVLQFIQASIKNATFWKLRYSYF